VKRGFLVLAAIAIAIALLILAPLWLNGYGMDLLYVTILSIGLAYGWNIISGYAGYFSFGQIAFFGFGAYVTALLVAHWSWYWVPAALAGGILSAALAIPLGYAMLRLRGPFFAMGMFGMAQMVRVLVTAIPATGSGAGLFLPPGSGITGVYYWTLAVCVGALGVETTRAKITAFGLSALIPGLLGGGYALFLTYIEPDAVFSSRLELQAIVMTILGGLGTVWGPLIGGLVMTQVSEALWARFPEIYLMIFGGLLVALLIALPRGIVPALAARFAARRRS
jgi:branched-chain amino acid transport system permease protein